MRKFEVLFDRSEPAALSHPAFELYGALGFPAPPPSRPWIYSNFVQSLDGIVSLKGRHAAGSDISQSPEDRWLMDLLRAHADAVILGVNTLVEEARLAGTRGPIYRIMDASLRELRSQLGRQREMNIFVTGAAALDLSEYRVFDGEKVDAVIVTTDVGAKRLTEKQTHPHVRILVAGEGKFVHLPLAMRMLREQLGIRYLLCEGGPTLYGYMSRAGLMDEKFLTVSPVEVGQIVPPEQEVTEVEKTTPDPLSGSAVRLRPTSFSAPGFTKEAAAWWTWVSCRQVEDHQFSRYRRK